MRRPSLRSTALQQRRNSSTGKNSSEGRAVTNAIASGGTSGIRRLRPSSPRSSAKSDSQRIAAAIAVGARRRSELLHRRAANIGSAADVALNQAFGFEFGIGVRDGGPMNAELRGKLAARGNAIARREVRRNARAREAGRAIGRRAECGFRAVNGVAALARSCGPIYRRNYTL